MSKKLLTIIGLIALGSGVVGSIALQSHAQVVSSSLTNQTSVSPVETSAQQEKNVKDTDNIQSEVQDNKGTDASIGKETGKNQEISGGTDVNEPAETNSIDTIEK